jgi:integrase
MDKQQTKHQTWQTRLAAILHEHGKTSANGGRVLSSATKDKRSVVLFNAFRQLRGMGYRLEEPAHLKEKHVAALMKKWEDEQLSSSTLQNRLSILRVFAEWIDKPGMVKDGANYVGNPDCLKRNYIAQEDKSWSTNGIEFESAIRAIATYDKYCAVQIKLIHAFGLRRKEGVMIKVLRADKGDYLLVTDGTKGGRDRVVPIETPYQKQVLTEAQDLAKMNAGFVTDRQLDLKQAMRRITYVMEKFGLTKAEAGVTLHGLRHEFANDSLERKGFISPVRRAANGEPIAVVNKDERRRTTCKTRRIGRTGA